MKKKEQETKEPKAQHGGYRAGAGCKGLKNIKDENGNPIVAQDFCFTVLEEEKQLIRDAINKERKKKGWMLIRVKDKTSPTYKHPKAKVVAEHKSNAGRKSWGFVKYVIRVTVAERKLVVDTVNKSRTKKGITLMQLQPGSLEFLNPKAERQKKLC